ncbi:methyl-accepting chemotaxis protein [Shewanella sp. A32]|uniref:methyl-accepting chemotaxis protein n=1 Tax=Shewanella sp. A32 TaxID=3031327 RepID=UPI0023B8D7CF|nr:methyl-accepting chemotaxis protein [Shewanella sp. A32]MDF0534614.1 methyl-accepting chemotaxis protein [Shewanella sp. A32]
MKFNKLTIKQKLLITMVLAVVLPSVLQALLGESSAKQVISQRMLTSELPNQLMQIRNRIELEIGTLLSASEQLAKDPMLGQWLAQGRPDAEEPLVEAKLQQLTEQYQLSQASYADRQSAAYYTQKGLLRILNHQQDGWFFDYVNSGKAKMLKLYTEPDTGDVKLFVNYQQVHGRALVGLGKSLKDMVSLLNSFRIEQTGNVFLTDENGLIQIHQNKTLVGKGKLSDLYGTAANALLQHDNFNLQTLKIGGTDTLVASSYIPTLGWYVVAQVPKQEIFGALEQTSWVILLWTLLITVGFIILAILVARSISQPIASAATMFGDLSKGDGDLRQRLPEHGNDELTELAHGFNRFIAQIHHSISEVANTSKTLTESATIGSVHAAESRQDYREQKDRTLAVVTAVNQMGATVSEIAANAAQAADAAKSANDEAASGQQVVVRARATINQLSDDVGQMSEVIASLSQHTEAIGSILDVIRSISEQTNLLALNAAIEAARAGEAGRGFSVVADEVRNLASRTAKSTNEVQQMIDSLQTEAANAVTAMEKSRSRSAEGVVAADEASDVLQQISARISLISDMNVQVAAATEEQATVVQDINRNLEEINEVSNRTSERAEATSNASTQLNLLAERLDKLVSRFRI